MKTVANAMWAEWKWEIHPSQEVTSSTVVPFEIFFNVLNFSKTHQEALENLKPL